MKKTRLGGMLFFALLLVLMLGMNVQAAEKKTVDYKAASFKIKTTISGTVTLKSNQTWLTIKQKSYGAKVYIAKNTGKERSGKVKLITGNKTITYKITQKAYNLIDDRFDYNWLALGKADVTKAFLKKVVKIADKLGVDPDDLMTVMAFESSLNHKAVNRYSNATGLIQFMPTTALALGTTVKKLKKMTALEQLDYVYAYLKRSGTLKNLGDLYMAILWPLAIGKSNSYVLWKTGSTAYANNSGLDFNKDGKVTRGECLKLVKRCRVAYVGA